MIVPIQDTPYYKLFHAAVDDGLIIVLDEPPGYYNYNKEHLFSVHNVHFNDWLHNFKGYEYENDKQYYELAIESNFREYLKWYDEKKFQEKQKRELDEEDRKRKAINYYLGSGDFVIDANYRGVMSFCTHATPSPELIDYADLAVIKVKKFIRQYEDYQPIILRRLNEHLHKFIDKFSKHKVGLAVRYCEGAKMILERLSIEYESVEVYKSTKSPTKKKKLGNKYSQRQVGIAYQFMNIPITTDNYQQILKKHSKTVSEKILSKRSFTTEDLTKVTGNKTTDTKHLQDLRAAKRLISGKKNQQAENNIDRIIKAFETAYYKHY